MVGGDESAEQPLAAAAEAVVLTALGADPLAAILEHASVDGDATTLAFALTCRVLNAARPAGKIRTRVIATLRNPQLQAWAASLGCPSPYPYWAEIHGLQGAAKLNGRVGRVLGPPNDDGRLPVEVDAGLGQLPRLGLRWATWGGQHGRAHLTTLLARVANVHPLTVVGEELVHAVHAEGGAPPGVGWSQVLLPRRHSCFHLEAFGSQFLESNTSMDSLNHMAGVMAASMAAVAATGEPLDRLPEDQLSILKAYRIFRGGMPGRERERGAVWVEDEVTAIVSPSMAPLEHAVWAAIQRSPLLAQCGVQLALQRAEMPRTRALDAMQNQLATMLMMDPGSGFAPSAWQDGIGDIYLYKAALGYQAHGRALDVGHLSLAEVGFLWHWTNGELGCGELVKNASAEAYQRGLQGYLKREELDRRRR